MSRTTQRLSAPTKLALSLFCACVAACGVLASCASPGPGGQTSAPLTPTVSAPSSGYVESRLHRAPADPPTVAAAGVAARLIYADWATPDISSRALASVPAPSQLHWPAAPQLNSLTIKAEKPPAAATINAFADVDANGIPSEPGMLTLNCDLGAPQLNQAAASTCTVNDSGSDGSIQVTVFIPARYHYLVLWAQWWTWPEGQGDPPPGTVRQVAASWAIAAAD